MKKSQSKGHSRRSGAKVVEELAFRYADGVQKATGDVVSA